MSAAASLTAGAPTVHPRSFAIVPAAGVSGRMGRSKLDLNLAGATLLERVLRALSDGGIEQTLVVLGPATAGLCKLVVPPAAFIVLGIQTPDMRATIEAGLSWISDHWRPTANDFWWLTPADQALLDASTVRSLVQHAYGHSGKIVVPQFESIRGHPVGFPWRLAMELARLPADQGVNALLRIHPELVVELPATADVVLDIDTPADIDRSNAILKKAGTTT